MAEMPKRTVFQMARRQSYANIGWEPEDVIRLRPTWGESQARAFLEQVEERLAAATLLAGWAALEALITEHEQGPDGEGQDQKGQDV